MKRSHIIMLVAAVLAVSVTAFIVNYTRTVEVRAGERVECTYGHTVSDSVKSIKVPARDASKYSVTNRQIVCDRHLQAQRLYNEAQAALRKGDVKVAKRKLAEVIALDPSFQRAKSQIDQIADGKKPKADGDVDTGGNGGTGNKPSTPGDDDEPSGPVASLTEWMPDTLTGYAGQKTLADAMSVSREYLPSGGGKGELLVISAEQIGGATAVKQALRQQVRLPYGTGGREIKINGRSGWVGTDGQRYATLGLIDGPVLVVLQVSSPDEPASELADELVAIAKRLPE